MDALAACMLVICVSPAGVRVSRRHSHGDPAYPYSSTTYSYSYYLSALGS